MDENIRTKLIPQQIEVFNLWIEYIRTYEIKIQQK